MRTIARLASVAAASGLLLGGTAVAHADFLPTALPGTGGPSTVIKTDNTDVKVTVGKVNAEAGTVDVSLTNSSANAYTCNVSKEANTVTEAALVDQAMAYYAGNVYPGAGGGLVDTGSLTSKIGTSSLAPLLGDVVDVPMAQLQKAQKAAQLAGHYGEFSGSTVKVGAAGAAGDTYKSTVTLTAPASGPRSDFQAGALVLCTRDDKTTPNNTYAFAGKGEAPAGTTGTTPAAEGGSLQMGSLGSK